MPGFRAPIRPRIRLVLIIAIMLIALVWVAPLFLGCESGISDGPPLPTICVPSVSRGSYWITGKNFRIGRLATWRQSLVVRPNNIVIMQIDGALDLADATDPRTFQINDLILIRGGGVIRTGGNYTNRPLIDGPIFGSGTLVLDDHLRLEASDLSGRLISMNLRGSRLLINDYVTLSAAGTNVTGIYVYGDADVRYSGVIDPATPTILVQGSESATGVEIRDGKLRFVLVNLRVEGANSVGVMGDSELVIDGSQIAVPDGVAVQMIRDGSLLVEGSWIAGGVAAIQGDDGAQIVDIVGLISGDIDLGDGDDHLRVTQDRYTQLKDGNITMGAGDDELTLNYREGVIDTPLDGGDGDDTLVITLKMTPGGKTPSAADIAAAEADGELALPAFTLRWTNFENVQIAYATNSGSEITPAAPEATSESS